MQMDEFQEELIKLLKEEMGDHVEISVNNVLKNNDTALRGLLFKSPDSNVAPTFYVDDFYKDYQEGTEISTIVDSLVEWYDRYKISTPVDMSFYEDFDSAKEYLFCKVINFEANRNYLESVPYERFMDLAIIPYCCRTDSIFGDYGVTVKQDHMELWGVSAEEVLSIAKENTRNFVEYSMVPIEKVLAEMGFVTELENESIGMYVVMNRRRMFAAACLIFSEVLEEFGNKLGEQYYILPSSVHELILVKYDKRMDIEELHNMVREVNEQEVPVTDILSNHAYLYRKGSGVCMNV